MQTLFIIVKGNAHTAQVEAAKRRIELTVTGESVNGRETYCEAPMTERAAVISWYAEDAGFGGNLMEGSCLWYAYRD